MVCGCSLELFGVVEQYDYGDIVGICGTLREIVGICGVMRENMPEESFIRSTEIGSIHSPHHHPNHLTSPAPPHITRIRGTPPTPRLPPLFRTHLSTHPPIKRTLAIHHTPPTPATPCRSHLPLVRRIGRNRRSTHHRQARVVHPGQPHGFARRVPFCRGWAAGG